MRINTNHSFPRCFFPTEKRKGTIGYNLQIQVASNNKTILEIREESLSEIGHLFLDRKGGIQIKVDDSYFEDLHPLIDENIFQPAFELCKSSILLFKSEEVQSHKIDLKSLPKNCRFSVKGCYGIEPLEKEEIAKVWFLLIESEEMEGIRIQQGLSRWVDNQPFYLLMGLEKYYYSLEDLWPTPSF